jgi:hypothetical protein
MLSYLTGAPVSWAFNGKMTKKDTQKEREKARKINFLPPFRIFSFLLNKDMPESLIITVNSGKIQFINNHMNIFKIMESFTFQASACQSGVTEKCIYYKLNRAVEVTS